MKFVDRFFAMILAIQNFLERIEEWYISKRKYILWVYILSFVTFVFLVLCRQMMLGTIVFIFGMLFVGFDNIIGWKHSVRRWLKICVVYNLFFSLILTKFVQGMLQSTMIDMVFVIIYLLVWTFLSLISNSKVAMLINEIVSVAVAAIYTIGTCLVSMALKDKPVSKDYLIYFYTDEAFELALASRNALAWEFFGLMCLEMLEVVFLSLLPVMGVSTLCIIMIKIKKYWIEKNKIPEPETKIGYNEETQNLY